MLIELNFKSKASEWDINYQLKMINLLSTGRKVHCVALWICDLQKDHKEVQQQ